MGSMFSRKAKIFFVMFFVIIVLPFFMYEIAESGRMSNQVHDAFVESEFAGLVIDYERVSGNLRVKFEGKAEWEDLGMGGICLNGIIEKKDFLAKKKGENAIHLRKHDTVEWLYILTGFEKTNFALPEHWPELPF